MRATIRNSILMMALAALVASCGDDGGTKVNKKAPLVVTFEVYPMGGELEGDWRIVHWDTSNANHVEILERRDGDVLDLVFSSPTMMTGSMEYRAHGNLDLVLVAYNTNTSKPPAESVVPITVEGAETRHIQGFYPLDHFVPSGATVDVHYVLSDVQAGDQLVIGKVVVDAEDASDTLTHTFDAAAASFEGTFLGSECGTLPDCPLTINYHTGIYAEFVRGGEVIEYRETGVSVIGLSPPVVYLFAPDDETIFEGGNTTLRWSVRNADSIDVQPGIGSSFCDDSGVCEADEVVTPTETTEYTLTATGPGGTTMASTTVTVTAEPTPPTIESFTASPAEIRPGTATTLTWDTTLADSVEITATPTDASLPATFTTDGTADVTPTVTTTYTLTATNPIGSPTLDATVTVTPLDVGDLVVTEIMADPMTFLDADAEWIEIHNPGTMEANLNAVTIAIGATTTYTVATDVLLPAGGYVLLAASSNTSLNDSLPAPDHVWSALDEMIEAGDTIVISYGSADLDTVTWDGTWTINEGYALSLDPDMLDATSNDTFANWCDAAAMWTGATANYGSPGAANPDC